MKLALATDHAGFEVLQKLKPYLKGLGHSYEDYGPPHLDMDDDYPDFITPAAQAVARGDCERGIILGGSGQGEAIAANRINGARAAVFYAPAIAKNSVDADGKISEDPYEIIRLARQHNNANILSLSGRFLSLVEIQEAVRIWLETPFSDIERHARRVKKLG